MNWLIDKAVIENKIGRELTTDEWAEITDELSGRVDNFIDEIIDEIIDEATSEKVGK